MTATLTETATLHGIVTLRDLLSALLDQPMDSKFDLSMQEDKTFPVDVEGYHVMYVNDQVFWKSMDSERRPIHQQDASWDEARPFALRHLTTVRDLILHLAQFDPSKEVALRGHFYTGIKITEVEKLVRPQTVGFRSITHYTTYDLVNI